MTRTPTVTPSTTHARVRQRRNGRERLLTAAADLFSTQAYVDITTREIAEKAGVTEAMLFRHFGSKADLFMEVAIGPFREYLDAGMTRWEKHRLSDSPEDSVRHVLEGLYEAVSSRRELLAVAIANYDPRAEAADPVQDAVQAALDKLTADQVALISALKLPDVYDFAIQTRLLFGMVLMVSLHGDWLFGKSGFDADLVLDEITRLTVFGGARYRAATMELAHSSKISQPRAPKKTKSAKSRDDPAPF